MEHTDLDAKEIQRAGRDEQGEPAHILFLPQSEHDISLIPHEIVVSMKGY
jgi:hypothetical protein